MSIKTEAEALLRQIHTDVRKIETAAVADLNRFEGAVESAIAVLRSLPDPAPQPDIEPEPVKDEPKAKEKSELHPAAKAEDKG